MDVLLRFICFIPNFNERISEMKKRKKIKELRKKNSKQNKI